MLNFQGHEKEDEKSDIEKEHDAEEESDDVDDDDDDDEDEQLGFKLVTLGNTLGILGEVFLGNLKTPASTKER